MATLIDKYRAVQRRLRRHFDPYTERICPECPSPCCRKPTKVREFDVILANTCGCALPSANEAVREMVDAGIRTLVGERIEDSEPEPCEYLGPDGCIFPDDLRPYECARWICAFLKREIAPGEMREIRGLLHRLSTLRRELVGAAGTHR